MKQRNGGMQKVVSVLLLVALLLTFATPVFAEGGPTPYRADPPRLPEGSGATGGAYHDPDGVKLTARQEEELSQKHALIERLEQLKKAGYSEYEMRIILDLPHKNNSASVAPDGGTLMYGSTYMGLWKEPENQPNWCGPGSGKAVISNWKTPPSMSYLANDAPRPCHSGSCNGMMTGSITRDSDWIYVVNDQIGQTWYEIANPSSVSSYKNYLEDEIYWLDHPLNNVVHTQYLPGWSWYNTTHYLAANGYNFYSNKVRYGDTAPHSATGVAGGYPFGWHWWSIDDFYNHLEYNHEIIW